MKLDEYHGAPDPDDSRPWWLQGYAQDEATTDNALREAGAAFDRDPEGHKPVMSVDWLRTDDEAP